MIIRIILGVLIVAAAGLYSFIEDDLYQLFNITGWIGLGLCGFAGMMSDGFRQPEYNREHSASQGAGFVATLWLLGTPSLLTSLLLYILVYR
ncbi:hypothetical protein ABEX25_22175 [Paenibacillus thiaminolyticus]|uniref:DUF5316 domain-containing protein n=1 Tax=Paenibacillus thiaminolyticus TaxID=49283 RepID=UPI003D2C6A94